MSLNASTRTGAVRPFTPRSKRVSALVGAAAAAAAMFASSGVFAASGIWSGGGATSDWSDAGNWDNVPGATSGITSADIATFNSNPTNLTVAVDANRNISGITFDTINAGAFTIGGNPLLLTSGGTIKINDPVDAAETINSALTV